ncbi:MAG: efflux RND transporter periplasmic adaptor subunit [Candidatus Acidiferrales bacterium]|jgi:multidrug efflux system membrane fusion protein
MKSRIFVGVLLTAALAAASGCSKQQAPGGAGGAPQMPPTLVTVAVAKGATVPLYLDEIGKSGAFESVTVMPQVAGRITERNFSDGADLKKGQVLFVIDPRPFQAQLDAAVAQQAQAKAALDLAQSQLKMYESLNDPRAVSQLDYQTKKNAVEVGQAQVQAADAAVENAKLSLDYCTIRSPIDGRAGARLVDVGNIVQANTTALLSIQRVDPIYADFTVTEQDLPKVRQQMSRGALKTLVRLPSDTDATARSGSLTFLDNAVQNATGTINLRATVANADHHFWPGEFVNVRLILATEANAVLIPNEATQISQRGPFVYVVHADNTAELRPVTLGQRQGDDVVVSSGVAAGERVVLTGQLAIIPGGPVVVAPPAPAGPGGPGASGGAAGTP